LTDSVLYHFSDGGQEQNRDETPLNKFTVSNGGQPSSPEEAMEVDLKLTEGVTEFSNTPAHFAILDTPIPIDHKFIHSESYMTPQRLKRIQKEHKILDSSLPEGIFVRAWESRLDLFRVLIIGPVDTPYEFAPFLIDMRLPSDYPQTPPEAHFHSWTSTHGPVNPNLYENGKICLSLLGTWHADERNENWSPSRSTVLQVLVSILGLVLVKEPYYNEAGFEVRAGSADSLVPSRLYSERTYFVSRGFISYALKNPPVAFEDVVHWLYRAEDKEAPRLLKRAIDAASALVRRGEGDDANEKSFSAGGLNEISKGALVLLKRQLAVMEKLLFNS
jgi:ubiquitin-conjugating enzyme E2 O